MYIHIYICVWEALAPCMHECTEALALYMYIYIYNNINLHQRLFMVLPIIMRLQLFSSRFVHAWCCLIMDVTRLLPFKATCMDCLNEAPALQGTMHAWTTTFSLEIPALNYIYIKVCACMVLPIYVYIYMIYIYINI